jgi:hypothetical protein
MSFHQIICHMIIQFHFHTHVFLIVYLFFSKEIRFAIILDPIFFHLVTTIICVLYIVYFCSLSTALLMVFSFSLSFGKRLLFVWYITSSVFNQVNSAPILAKELSYFSFQLYLQCL